jgi:AAA+ superfamily predicted ATPase
MFSWVILPLLFIWGRSKFITTDRQGNMGLLGMGDSIEMFVGIGAARVRGLFDRAKQQAPSTWIDL